MKVGPKGREVLAQQVVLLLDMKKSGVPETGIATMFTHWITSLLNNIDANPELRKQLEE